MKREGGDAWRPPGMCIKKAACRVARQAVESARCGRSGSPRSGSRRRVLQEGGLLFLHRDGTGGGGFRLFAGDDDGQHTVLVAGADVFHISIFS